MNSADDDMDYLEDDENSETIEILIPEDLYSPTSTKKIPALEKNIRHLIEEFEEERRLRRELSDL